MFKHCKWQNVATGSTAANWMPNQPVIIPPPQTFEALQARNEEIKKNQNGITWYLSFKEPPEKCIEAQENFNKLENKNK